MTWPWNRNPDRERRRQLDAALARVETAPSGEQRNDAARDAHRLIEEIRHVARAESSRRQAAYTIERQVRRAGAWTPGRWTRVVRSLGDLPWARRTPIAGSIADAADDGIGKYGGSTADSPSGEKYR